MYIQIIDNKLVAWSATEFLGYTAQDDTDYNDFVSRPEKYILKDGEIIIDPNFSAKQFKKAKQDKTNEINEAKEQAFKAGIEYDGYLYDCDDRAQDRTGNRLTLLNAEPTASVIWLDYDYKPHELSAEGFIGLCSAIFERVQFIEFKTGELLAQVEAAETLSQLDNIEILF